MQWECGVQRHNDLWYLDRLGDGTYMIRNYRSGLCMNVNGASFDNGAGIIQWDCGVARQNDVWILDPDV